MLLKFRVDLASSLRRGVDCPVPPVVSLEIDPAQLSQEDRDILAARLHCSGVVATMDEQGFYNTKSSRCTFLHDDKEFEPITSATPLLADLLAAIRSENEAAATREARLKADADAKAAESQAEGLKNLHGEPIRQTRAGYVHLLRDGSFRIGDSSGCCNMLAERGITWQREYIHTHYGDDATKAACKVRGMRLDAESEQRHKDVVEAAKVELIAKCITPRTEWVNTYGSPDLRRMVAEGMNWMPVYDEEHAAWQAGIDAGRLLAERPGWTVVEASAIEPPCRPRARAWSILDAARLVEPSAKLGKLNGKYVAYAEFDGKTIVWPAD